MNPKSICVLGAGTIGALIVRDLLRTFDGKVAVLMRAECQTTRIAC